MVDVRHSSEQHRTSNNRALTVALAIHRLRQRRHAVLGDVVLSEHPWDMLLDLYVAEVRGKRLSASALCLGTSCSAATALRYIRTLSERGLIESTDDPADRRRRFISLTQHGLKSVTSLLLAFEAA